MSMSGFKNFVKHNFFTGLIVIIPILVVVWLTRFLFERIWSFYGFLPGFGDPDSSLALGIKFLLLVGVSVVSVGGLAILGWVSNNFIGKKILTFLRELMEKIPILGTIYTSIEQLMTAIASGTGKQFSRVVWLEYPRKGIWTIAFVTGTSNGRWATEGNLNLFVPTVPNPTSGFFLNVPESEVKKCDMKVEEAFKVILSLGIAQPGIKNRDR